MAMAGCGSEEEACEIMPKGRLAREKCEERGIGNQLCNDMARSTIWKDDMEK